MKVLLLLPMLVLLPSCREPAAEVEVKSTRPLSTADESPKINATPAEQFLPPEVRAQIGEQGDGDEQSGGEWTYLLPDGWQEGPTKAMREVNLTFGPVEAQGEIYLSVVGGTVEANIVRWFRQFGTEPAPFENLAKVLLLGQEAYLVEAEGRYESGMGQPGTDDYRLLGTIAESEGRLVTVKMVGPAETVLAERVNFLKFIASLTKS